MASGYPGARSPSPCHERGEEFHTSIRARWPREPRAGRLAGPPSPARWEVSGGWQGRGSLLWGCRVALGGGLHGEKRAPCLPQVSRDEGKAPTPLVLRL